MNSPQEGCTAPVQAVGNWVSKRAGWHIVGLLPEALGIGAETGDRRGLQAGAQPERLTKRGGVYAMPSAGVPVAGRLTGVFNGNGAPALEPPAQSFSANDMIDLLRSIRSKSDEAQISSAKENLSAARTKMEMNNEAQLQKIEEELRKDMPASARAELRRIGDQSKHRVRHRFDVVGQVAAVAIGIGDPIDHGDIRVAQMLGNVVAFELGHGHTHGSAPVGGGDETTLPAGS